MALFAAVAELAEELAGEAGRLKKRAAIAGAIAAGAYGRCRRVRMRVVCAVFGGDAVCGGGCTKLNGGGALLSKVLPS